MTQPRICTCTWELLQQEPSVASSLSAPGTVSSVFVLNSWQAHVRVRIVNRSDVTHVSEIVMVGRNIIEEEL